LAAAKQPKINSQDRRIRYILDIAEKSGINLSIANETETRRILNKLPTLSEEIVENRRS